MSIRLLVLLVVVVPACGSDTSLSSDDQARRAYEGLDKSIAKSITLGFAGFNSASSANIAPQMTTGGASGTLVVTGQVDQGSSANKGMRLNVALTDYSDGKFVDTNGDEVTLAYATDTATPPALGMMLKGIPTGTIAGTLTGSYHVTGDLAADATLNLTFTGNLQAGLNNTVERKPGTVVVTGTATSGAGTYNVMVTL